MTVVIPGVLFAYAVLASAVAYAQHARAKYQREAWEHKLESNNKVGKWYQDRVAELENESRALAEQVVASGGVVRHAMPFEPVGPPEEFAYDATGLVRERLDPRDLPYE
jgi:hypothetical protein